MIKLGMRSLAETVKGQGVGSAYAELLSLLRKYGKKDFQISINHDLGSCDVLHYHTIDPVSLMKMMTAQKATIASVHFIPETFDGSLNLPLPVSLILNRYTVWFYKSADFVHVVTPAAVPKLVQYGIPKSRIRVIPNVVSTDGFYKRTAEERKQIRSRYGVSEKGFLVVGCGQIQTRKGVAEFAEVARRMPEVRFIWAGGFSFGAMSDGYAELKQLMQSPPANLKFTGIVEREEVSALMGAADVFFLPSHHEQFCMAILEAAACGVPILLRDLSEYHTIYGSNCLYGRNAPDFVRKLRALQASPELRTRFSRGGEKLMHYYSEQRIYALWKKFYHDCAEYSQRISS